MNQLKRTYGTSFNNGVKMPKLDKSKVLDDQKVFGCDIKNYAKGGAKNGGFKTDKDLKKHIENEVKSINMNVSNCNVYSNENNNTINYNINTNNSNNGSIQTKKQSYKNKDPNTGLITQMDKLFEHDRQYCFEYIPEIINELLKTEVSILLI